MVRGCLAPAFAPRKGGIKALRFKANAQAVKKPPAFPAQSRFRAARLERRRPQQQKGFIS